MGDGWKRRLHHYVYLKEIQMSIYSIKNGSGEEVNRIEADEVFVEAHFAGRYEQVVLEASPMPEEGVARRWRNDELAFYDKAAQIQDWPNRANILLYRTALRSWPEDADNFPDTPPVLAT